MERGSLLWTWTLAVLLLIFTLNFLRFRFRFVHLCFRNQKPAHSNPVTNGVADSISSPLSQHRISGIISDLDLKNLIDDLDEKFHEDIIWENVIDKSNNRFSYKAKCCKQKDGPLKYLSVTTFENCSIEVLMKYYMDNDYRKLWDKTVVEHEQLQVDQASGTEIGRTVKKFPFLTPREYVLAWRVWQGKDGSFYCFSKESEHPLAPRQRRYIRVKLFRSGWRIRKDGLTSTVHPEDLARAISSSGTLESNAKRLSRMPSNKLIRNGLIVVGGVLCLSRGHSSLGAKVAMACILNKLTKRGSSSNKAGKVH
ncbi:uncharacterized protein LOC111384713 isoform X3 [Olea europaea var. sylvestris]|uniref:uncharacterized protein LOC111384713 isoform X3 n=1 Tax=Olea europaea var. sylvestris TaxID=158386 RepID=UPI000C1D34FB|nr:uncharacterized protein LOC111384713 isoform X3 [Olea europaea var. sylvestris]